MAGREFYTLSINEIGAMMDAVRVRRERHIAEEEARFYNMLNAFGSVMGGKKWKWQSPSQSTETPEDFEEREKRVLTRLAERRRLRAQA